MLIHELKYNIFNSFSLITKLGSYPVKTKRFVKDILKIQVKIFFSTKL